MDDIATWPIEDIPDGCIVYMRAHRDYFKGSQLRSGVFKPRGDGGMSVDWGKYSTAVASRLRAKEPAKNSVIRLSAKAIRAIQSLQVKHAPDFERNNRAHSNILGLPEDKVDLTATRLDLLQIAAVVITHEAD